MPKFLPEQEVMQLLKQLILQNMRNVVVPMLFFLSVLTTTNPLKREFISTTKPSQVLYPIYHLCSTMFQGVLV
jgi:hypothetical protein